MNKNLVIIGIAPCANDDICELQAIPFRLFVDCDWLAVGVDAVDRYIWPLKYMATYHPEDIEPAFQRRKSFIGDIDFKVISHIENPGVDIIIPYEYPSGSSALLGAMAGIEIGYKKIILCGCPLQGVNSVNHDYNKFHEGWKVRKDLVCDKVRSMSGWTAEFLGKPTGDWLDE